MSRLVPRALAVVLAAAAALMPEPSYAASTRQEWQPRPRFEADLVKELATRRREGAVCGTRVMPAAAPVRRDEALDAAARVQAAALIDTGVFAHRPQGQSPRQRVVAAGFGGTYRGEALAKDAPSVAAALDAWWASPGHCRTLMDARADSIGVSVVNRRFRRGPWLSYWVVVMGANESEGAK